MSPFRHVVVGFDGSDAAYDALALAARLVDRDSGELILAGVDAQRGFRMPHGRVRPTGHVLDSGLAAVPPGLRASVSERPAASSGRGLAEIAEQVDADLLVLGAHRGAMDQHVTPGPTAHRLLQGAPCAVAIAPRGLRETDRFHHVGVAYDGSPEADAALAAAYALAARDGAAVSLFRVMSFLGTADAGDADAAIEVRARAQDSLDSAADAAPAGVNPRTVLLHGEPVSEVAQASDGVVDVLFCGSRGYGPLLRVLAGSVSRGLLLSATQPFVVLPRATLAAAAPS